MQTPNREARNNWTDPTFRSTPQIIDGQRWLDGKNLGPAPPLDLDATCQRVNGRVVTRGAVLHSRYTQAQRRRALSQ